MSSFLPNKVVRLVSEIITNNYVESQKENIDILKPPKIYFLMGIVSAPFCGIMMVLMLFTVTGLSEAITTAAGFGIVCVMGIFFILYGRNFRVVYRDGEIIYKNSLGKTRIYACRNIVHTYYRDNGGIQFLFRDGRKLSFDGYEIYFCNRIIEKENLRCEFKGGLPQVINVYSYSSMFVLGTCAGVMMVLSFVKSNSDLLFSAIFCVLICIGFYISNTSYDRDERILTCRKCGFAKHYDMRRCQAKPVYEGGLVVKIEIYDGKKKVTTVLTYPGEKNRAWLIRALCNIDS